MGVESRDHHQIQNDPSVESSISSSSVQPIDEPPIKRTGNIWTGVAHIITGVIGAGVLSLAWSMAQLGWIAGPLTMLLFASVTFVSAVSLCNCYRSPDPETGPIRNTSYLEAVRTILGPRSATVCSVFLRINYCKVGIVYTITAAVSMRAIQKSNCYHKEGHRAACGYGHTSYMLFFGIVQTVLSQIPNFRDTKWLSIIAAIMSFAYSIIGSALGLEKVIDNGNIKGNIGGVPTSTPAKKVWLVSQAIGDIAFAFPFSVILIEIQDTLKSPPPEKVTMKKASMTGISITTFFYICCGGFGYAAFGDSAPGNLLTGFGFFEPYWLIDFANACIILHLIGAYQVFSQPLFADLERWISKKFPNSGFIHHNYSLKAPWLPAFRLNLLRLCFRTTYVAFITGIAIAFPYFNQVVGVAGSINFWPLIVYFPVEMYIAQTNIGAWTKKWILLRAFTFACLLVMLFALVGSIEGLIEARFG
ncbi:probable amino acid permease 7 isoform X1 [Actinidia eriantha]|uniref:probable amino acid permease 7 isoform X1 n=1 Tax=Actinidia eriantha TaxID=165200 RepID=UPI0025837274|nr:probable amino acid permease 7 isoform X1 [Actinidia eriantha]XP_057485307.1 probable amino acid permease 7 isoform X1 [Actinidia eriantha]